MIAFEDPGLHDIHEFIKNENKSLLIKGNSGTGRATLAAEIAKKHLEKFEIIFISQNVSINNIYKRFPWTKDFLKQSNLISIKTNPDFMLSESSVILDHLLNIISTRIQKIEDPFVSLKPNQNRLSYLKSGI